MSEWKNRSRAAVVHLLISLVIAACAALLVFGVWYPYPYREISGGRELFLLVVGVDVVLGPLFTFIVFNRAKPSGELIRDLAVVGMVQLAGLGYGLWTVYAARPVHLVFEIDRFRAVHAVDVPDALLPKTPDGVTALPLNGPSLLAVRPFVSEQERMDATLAAVQGVSLGSRPDLWQSYVMARPRILAAARPVSQLRSRYPAQAVELDRAIADTGQPEPALVFLPLVGRKAFWTVLLDARTAQVVGYVPLDSF